MKQEIDTIALIEHARVTAGPYSLRPPARLLRGPVGHAQGIDSGSSIDFYDYRSYQPGDDLRRVDWRVFARSDQMVIRRFRSEVSPVLDVLLDGSASMGLYPGKAAAAAYASSFLAGACRNARGRPVLVHNGQRFGGNDFEHGLAAVTFDQSIGVTDFSPPPETVRGPMRVIISDFLMPLEPGFWRKVSRHTAGLIVIRVLSESEREPRFHGGFRFVDAERREHYKDIRVNRSTVSQYKKRLNAHLESLEETWRGLRAVVVPLDVADDWKDIEETGKNMIAALAKQEVITLS